MIIIKRMIIIKPKVKKYVTNIRKFPERLKNKFPKILTTPQVGDLVETYHLC